MPVKVGEQELKSDRIALADEPFNRADDRRSSFSEGHVEILNQEEANDNEN